MITLTREEAQQVLDALAFSVPQGYGATEIYRDSVALLDSKLSAPEPAPTGFIRTLVKVRADGTETWTEEAFYTAPAQREWQGLTDEERESIASKAGYNPLTMTVYEYRVIIQKETEAKLKEKNK